MTSRDMGPSWDSDGQSAPVRPRFASHLSEEPALPRPGRTTVAAVLVIVAACLFVIVTVLAAFRLDEVREALTTALPDDLREDYSDREVRHAVRVLIGVIAGVGALLTVAQLLSIRSLVRHRSSAARIVFVIVVVLHLPVSLAATAVRDGGRLDEALSVIAAVCLLVAAVLVCGGPVSRWLRQREQHDPIPLVRPSQPNPSQPNQNEPNPSQPGTGGELNQSPRAPGDPSAP